MTDDTFSVHHFNGGWLDEGMRGQNQKAQELYERVYERTKLVKVRENILK